MLRFPLHSALRWWGLLLATVTIVLPPAPSLAKDEITWLEVNMPPYLIQEGPLQGQGYGNVIGAILEQHLPEYDHHRLVTNVIRHFDMFKRATRCAALACIAPRTAKRFCIFPSPA